jgi:hypothetical protein
MMQAALRPYLRYFVAAIVLVVAVLLVAAIVGTPASHLLANGNIDGWLDGR